MPEIAIELTYEKILEAASKLSEEDRERLFLSLNKDYAKALVVTITLGTLGILGTFPV